MAELKLALRLDVLGLPLKRALDLAASMGVHAVELDGRGEVHPESLSETGLRHLKKLLEERNLKVAAVRFQTRSGFDNPDNLQRRVEATKSAMDLAYKLGTTSVINFIGRVPEDSDDPHYHALQSVIDDLGRYGARVGAFLAAETGAESGETLSEFLGAKDDGFVAVALNPGQLIINRHSVVDAVERLKDRVQVVCATDGVLDLAEGRGISVPLGEGTADYPQILASLEDVGFRGHFTVGRKDSAVAEMAQGLKYLGNL